MKTVLITSLLLLATSPILLAQSIYAKDKIRTEKLGRGVVAVRESAAKVAVTWRYLSSDPEDIAFDIYRNGKKVNSEPIAYTTHYTDTWNGEKAAEYEVRPVGRKSGSKYTLPENAPIGYLEIPVERPDLGVDPYGKEYFYTANDASVGDVDGDGEYEIFLKWDPTNSHDNAHDGFTGPTLIDCYRLDGTRLWRIDLGENIRSGAHYTPFLVADFDGDGCAELICKTADGTLDGKNKLIGDRKADFRNMKGRIIAGPEYLTVFNGMTGEAMATIDYQPAR
ncbi:MAG: rhamnogalacturonan lyase, partial [Ruminococcus flavefaciens]|nr:rhamnogalacturonan lyase [Ruminococcus flavefaciens]